MEPSEYPEDADDELGGVLGGVAMGADCSQSRSNNWIPIQARPVYSWEDSWPNLATRE